jgi:hypothetical protein
MLEIDKLTLAGLDPGIQPTLHLFERFLLSLDGRDKPGHDERR